MNIPVWVLFVDGSIIFVGVQVFQVFLERSIIFVGVQIFPFPNLHGRSPGFAGEAVKV